MKRLFTLIVSATAALSAMATDYTDSLLVLVNGEGTGQQATITVTEHDGLYDLNLKNFILMNGNSPVPVGNVELTGIVPEQAGDAIFLRTMQDIQVTEGDQAGVAFWMGPMLGSLPVEVTAVLEDGGLRALINLDLMAQMQQVVEVRFGKSLIAGKGYHIPNGDFEAWHASADNFVEPNAWHSFESASGALAPLAGHHIEKSAEGRNGSSCARIFATSIFGIVANGTMTTGRMNAGAFSADDKQNNAYLDMSKEDVDGNGDPFYVSLNSRPDSLTFWVRFRQGTVNSDHPYATVSAVITDGTYYQDPEDKAYTNVVARAANRKIATTGDAWQRISVPFVYEEGSVEPKAILVTISTNADAGQGSDGDEVFVDDLTLVYNSRLSELNVGGFSPDKFEYDVEGTLSLDDIVAVADSRDAYVLKRIVDTEDGQQAVVTVYSADLRSHTDYTLKFDGAASAVALSMHPANATTYYTLGGQHVATPTPGHVYVVRQSDGQSKVTVIKK